MALLGKDDGQVFKGIVRALHVYFYMGWFGYAVPKRLPFMRRSHELLYHLFHAGDKRQKNLYLSQPAPVCRPFLFQQFVGSIYMSTRLLARCACLPLPLPDTYGNTAAQTDHFGIAKTHMHRGKDLRDGDGGVAHYVGQAL